MLISISVRKANEEIIKNDIILRNFELGSAFIGNFSLFSSSDETSESYWMKTYAKILML